MAAWGIRMCFRPAATSTQRACVTDGNLAREFPVDMQTVVFSDPSFAMDPDTESLT